MASTTGRSLDKAQVNELYLYIDKDGQKKEIVRIRSVQNTPIGLNFEKKDPGIETAKIFEYKVFEIRTGKIYNERLWSGDFSGTFKMITEKKAYDMIVKSEVARSVLKARVWMGDVAR